MPFEGGAPVKTFDIPQTAGWVFRWTANSRALTYIDTRSGVSNIWSLPLDGGKPTQLTDFKADQIFFFDWSSDGKQLAAARGLVTNDGSSSATSNSPEVWGLISHITRESR